MGVEFRDSWSASSNIRSVVIGRAPFDSNGGTEPSDAPSKTALAVVLVANITIGIGYSFGRVTKRYPGATIALLTATLVMPWVTGIAAGNGTLSSEQWRVAVAVAVLLATVSVIIAGAKDSQIAAVTP